MWLFIVDCDWRVLYVVLTEDVTAKLEVVVVVTLADKLVGVDKSELFPERINCL